MLRIEQDTLDVEKQGGVMEIESEDVRKESVLAENYEYRTARCLSFQVLCTREFLYRSTFMEGPGLSYRSVWIRAGV